ncbi:MAG TPA: TolC family protein [Nannocystis exedens]|nr:TolC family protein [Nannocystis exedens]
MSIANFLIVGLLLAPPPGATCQGRLARGAVVECALAASLGLEALGHSVDAVAARRLSARSILPSNPRVQVTLADRRSAEGDARTTNIYTTLSQELEIGGQRRRRLAVVDAAVDVEHSRVQALRRELAAEALRRYFEALAARDERAMIERIDNAVTHLEKLARVNEEVGLGSGVEAEIVAATAIKVRRRAIQAQRRQEIAEAQLASLLGLDPASAKLDLIGELRPLEISEPLDVLVERGLGQRAELKVVAAEREAQLRQEQLYKRKRVPNPSLVFYGQRDGFFEQVFGGGIGLEIPLPSPLGQTYKGEIAESRARVRQAAAELQVQRRRIRGEVVTAQRAMDAANAEFALFEPSRLAQAETDLEKLSQEIEAGRLTIREGALQQLALLDLLATYIDVCRERCLSSVELARAAALLPESQQ